MSKLVFFGTPEFSVPSLELLHKKGHQVSLVVCQPDRKKGRGLQMVSPAVKQFALESGLSVFQPKTLSNHEVTQRLDEEKADFFIVIAYGRFLPVSVLGLPLQSCINAHPSLLPKYRGPSPIQYSLLNGEKKTGVSTMLISEEMDAGDILLSKEIAIETAEKYDGLSQRLSVICAEMLCLTLEKFDTITPQPQNPNEVTFCKLIGEQDRRIDWNQTALEIYNRFRALSPTPGIFTAFRGKRLILKDLKLLDENLEKVQNKGGEILAVLSDKIRIACSVGILEIQRVQPENKKEISVNDWINGYQVKAGELLE